MTDELERLEEMAKEEPWNLLYEDKAILSLIARVRAAEPLIASMQEAEDRLIGALGALVAFDKIADCTETLRALRNGTGQ